MVYWDFKMLFDWQQIEWITVHSSCVFNTFLRFIASQQQLMFLMY